MTRSTPQVKKEQLIADLSSARQEVLGAAMALHGDERDTPFLGTWSAHDIVAHLVGWDWANLEAIEAIRAGRLPAFYEHHDRDWGTFNASLVAKHRQPAIDDTVAQARASHRALLEAVEAVPAQDLGRDYGVRSPGKRRVTIAMLLAVEARDERKHAGQILEFEQRGQVR